MIRVPKKYAHEYTCCVPKTIENQIMQAVVLAVTLLRLSDDERADAVECARLERICNLSDTIQIDFY